MILVRERTLEEKLKLRALGIALSGLKALDKLNRTRWWPTFVSVGIFLFRLLLLVSMFYALKFLMYLIQAIGG